MAVTLCFKRRVGKPPSRQRAFKSAKLSVPYHGNGKCFKPWDQRVMSTEGVHFTRYTRWQIFSVTQPTYAFSQGHKSFWNL